MQYDIYIMGNKVKAAFAGKPLWYGNTFYTNPSTTVDDGEEFAIIEYYCDGQSNEPSLLYYDNFPNISNARNKEWVEERLATVIKDNEENMRCYLNDGLAVVNIYKCAVTEDNPEVFEVETIEIS